MEVFIGTGGSCDFCGCQRVERVFHAPDFLMCNNSVVSPISVGDWQLCRDCSEDVDTGNGTAILERTVEAWFQANPMVKSPEHIANISNVLMQTIEAFFKHYTGSEIINDP